MCMQLLVRLTTKTTLLSVFQQPLILHGPIIMAIVYIVFLPVDSKECTYTVQLQEHGFIINHVYRNCLLAQGMPTSPK